MYPYKERTFKSNGFNNRADLRKALILEFLKEKPGKGREEKASRYRYYVEQLASGSRIFLKRPATLNKGFDFEIWVEKWNNGKDGMPSHPAILEDLKSKKHEAPLKYKTLLKAIHQVYRLSDPDDVLRSDKLNFNSGYDAEILLKVLKWMFIEQDITYWNKSGRAMLKGGIESI